MQRLLRVSPYYLVASVAVAVAVAVAVVIANQRDRDIVECVRTFSVVDTDVVTIERLDSVDRPANHLNVEQLKNRLWFE